MNGYLMLKGIFYDGAKAAGVCCILSAAVGLGYTYNRHLRERLHQLRQLQQVIQLLKGEIEYSCSPLPEAMIHSGMQVDGVCGAWMAAFGRRMYDSEGIGFGELWKQQVEVLQEQSVLTSGITDELIRLGTQLSKPDRNTQLGAFELCIQRLREEEKRLGKELPEKLRLVTTLMVLGGVFLVVLFM